MKSAKSKTIKKNSAENDEISIEEKVDAMDSKMRAKIKVHVTTINSLLVENNELSKKISKNEKSKQRKAREIAIEIGEIRKLVIAHNKECEDEIKINLREYLEILFKKDIRRINECEAINKAMRLLTLAPESVRISTLIILGQALNSSDSKKAELAKKTLSDSKLPDGKSLSEAKVTSITKSLNQASSNKVGKTYFKSLETIIKNLDDKVTAIHLRQVKTRNNKDKIALKETTSTLISSCNEIIGKLKVFSEEI